MAERKRQHWVPQFYLRRFATNSDKTLINLYLLEGRKFIGNVGLSGQCQEDNFYGKDRIIEEALGQLEGVWTDLFRRVEAGDQLTENIRHELCLFAAMQSSRTAVIRENSQKRSDGMPCRGEKSVALGNGAPRRPKATQLVASSAPRSRVT
jgi:hypothetical protein